MQLSMGCALQATGKHKQTSHLGVAATVVSVLITIFLISRYNVMGASWAWVVRAGISLVFLLPLFIGSFPATLPRVPIARILACTLLMGALLWYVSTLSKLHLLGVGVAGCVAVALYVGGLILLRVLDPSALTQGVRRRLEKFR
jgi:O-antigen/teichoic acid export membrane protein